MQAECNRVANSQKQFIEDVKAYYDQLQYASTWTGSIASRLSFRYFGSRPEYDALLRFFNLNNARLREMDGKIEAQLLINFAIAINVAYGTEAKELVDRINTCALEVCGPDEAKSREALSRIEREVPAGHFLPFEKNAFHFFVDPSRQLVEFRERVREKIQSEERSILIKAYQKHNARSLKDINVLIEIANYLCKKPSNMYNV